MNFKNIEKFLKKNYKKIIIVCLIILLLSNKMYEKFTTVQALDGVKAIEKKVNNMFYEVDANWIKSSKGIYGKKTIEADGNVVSRKGNVSAKVDVIADRNMTATGNVTAKKDIKASNKVTAGKNLCIGGTCINEDQLKILTGGKYFSIQSGRSNKRLKDDSENAKFDNENDGGHEAMRIIKVRNK